MVSVRWARAPEPASWLEGHGPSCASHAGPTPRHRARCTLGTGSPPIPRGHEAYQTAEADPGGLAEGSARKEALGRAILTGGRGIPRIAVSGWRRSASDGSAPATSGRQT